MPVLPMPGWRTTSPDLAPRRSAVVGRRSPQGSARSSCAATRKRMSSRPQGATICTPIGSPLVLRPRGRLIAGRPPTPCHPEDQGSELGAPTPYEISEQHDRSEATDIYLYSTDQAEVSVPGCGKQQGRNDPN